MARPKGSRSEGYETRRRALARQVFQCVFESGTTSLSAMAEHTGVSRPTLRHYFGDREGAVRAALEVAAELSEEHIQRVADLPVDDERAALRKALADILRGWRTHGVGRIHEVGLKIGLDDLASGETYIGSVLEPLLQAVETLIGRLVEAGRLAPLDARTGALELCSPVVLALLHQGSLGGDGVRPLDLDALADRVVDDFCRAHRAG